MKEQEIQKNLYVKSIKNFDIDTIRHLNIMLCALSKIEDEYIRYKGEDTYMSDKLINERVFAYELYYQWKKILEEKHESCMLNGEIKKDGKIVGFHKKKENCTDCKSLRNDVYPDMVLHQNHDTGKGRNIIVCELKVNHYAGYTKYIEDIASLATFTSDNSCDGNPYEMAIFILVGSKKRKSASEIIKYLLEKRIETIKQKASEYVGHLNNTQNYNKIILVAYNSNKDIYCYNLGDYIP